MLAKQAPSPRVDPRLRWAHSCVSLTFLLPYLPGLQEHLGRSLRQAPSPASYFSCRSFTRVVAVVPDEHVESVAVTSGNRVHIGVASHTRLQNVVGIKLLN